MKNQNQMLRRLISEERTFIADFRGEINKLCDKFNRHLDELELRISKEKKSAPAIFFEQPKIES